MIINEEEAIERAKETAEKNGWVWVEPIEITWRPAWFGRKGKWAIITNARGLGAKVRIVIDNEGQVLEQGYVPR